VGRRDSGKTGQGRMALGERGEKERKERISGGRSNKLISIF
jgi:hypothetical protein